MLRQCVLFALVGLGLETAFTGLFQPMARFKLYKGYASVLYLSTYSLIPPLMYITPPEWAWWHRGLWYLLLIYVIEGVSNVVIQEYYGTHPSEESYLQGWNYKGLVNLEPQRVVTWFGTGLFLEWLWRTQ